jgi:hypothetical protein
MTTRPANGVHARPEQALQAWYAATALFLVLDYVFGVNIRVAFLEFHPALRAAYYLFCFLCLGLVLWQPDWSVIVGAFESLVTLVALILGFGIRVLMMTLPDAAYEQPVLTPAEILNFLLSGTVAWYVWTRGMRQLAAGGGKH